MRITLVTEAFHPAVDGTTRAVQAVADRLVDTGHLVQVVAPGPGLTSYRGSPVVRTAGRRGARLRLREALAAFAPAVVHAVGTGPLARAAEVEATRLHLPLLSGVPAAWTPGVDTDAFHPGLRDPWLHQHWSRARSGSGHPLTVVGFAGSLTADHDVRRLTDLVALPGVRLVVIGDGPRRGWLAARLPGARFTGHLHTGDLAVALATLDVLVHPGGEVGCCSSLREAAASGVPVVAPATGAVRGVVRSLETGLLHDPDDPHGLRTAVTAVAADGRRSLLGACAREHVLGRGWATAVDALVADHYQPLLARRRVAPAV